MDWEQSDPFDVIAHLPKNFYEDLASKKWQERKEALDQLNGLLTAHKRLVDNQQRYSDIVDQLGKTLKNDSNINVTAMAAKCLLGFVKGLRGKFAPYSAELASICFDRFKEKKALLKDPLVELIDAIFANTSYDIVLPPIQEAIGKLNPNIKIQVDLFLFRIFTNLPAQKISKGSLKELVGALVKHTLDPLPDVRDAACMALGALMKCIGDVSVTTLIGSELANDKTKMAKIVEAKERAVADAAAAALAKQSENSIGMGENGGQVVPSTQGEDINNKHLAAVPSNDDQPAVDPWELLDPVDIADKVSKQFTELLASKKWQERKEALEQLNGLLAEHKRLADNQQRYSDIVDQLGRALKNDSNINVTAMAAKCLVGFAKGLRGKFAPYSAEMASICFEKFKEKKALLKDPLVELIDAIFASTTLSALSHPIMEAFGRPNPSQKMQLDLFLYRAFRGIRSENAPKELVKGAIGELTKHASHSDPEVRDASYSALGAIMKCIGEKPFSTLLASDISGDSTKMAKIIEYRDKALSECPPPSDAKNKQKIGNGPQAPILNGSNKPNNTAAAVISASEMAEKNGQSEQTEEAKAAKAKQSAAEKMKEKPPKPPTPPAPAPPPEPEFLLLLRSDRQGRHKDEKSLRVLKWNFDIPQAEHLEQLSAALGIVSKQPLTGQLLSKDFRQHIKAIEYLNEVHRAQPECIINNIDLLLKWSSLRFFDTNPAVLIRMLEFVLAIFIQMDAMDEKLDDLEVQAFLPYLLIKSGDQKEVIRSSIREIVNRMNYIVVPAKIFPILLDSFKTKNTRQKAECIAIADSIIEVMGINITNTPQVTMKTLAACISDRDNGVRNAALNAILTVYKKIGDGIYKLIGKLGEKEKAMLEERIKRAGSYDPNATASQQNRLNTTRDVSSAGRLINQTHDSSMASGGKQQLRARSASGSRRSLALPLSGGHSPSTADDASIAARAARRSEAPLPSAQSHSSSLNTATTTNLFSAGGIPAGKFQLDPKFFQNDVYDDTLTPSSAVDETDMTLVPGGSAKQLNKTFTKVIEQNNSAGGERPTTATMLDQQDLQPIKPVVRPVSTFTRRSESVSSISSLESAEHIDRAVFNVSCLQLNIAEEAIAQLLHLLNEPANRRYIEDRGDLILKMIVTQIFHIRSQHLESLESLKEGDNKREEFGEFMRSVCNFLSSLAKEQNLLQKISADTLKTFLDALLALLSEPRLNSVNSQIFRSLNVVVIRLCEHTNPNSCFLALLKLITRYQTTDPTGKMLDFARKCFIKHSEVIADPIKLDQLDIVTILEAIHEFFEKFPSPPQSSPDNDSPLQKQLKETLKFLFLYLQRIVVRKRYKVLDYLYPFPQNSQMVTYLRRCLRAVGKKQQDGKQPTADGSTAISEDLEEMFRRVEEDLFGGAVEDLYNFMDIHQEHNANFEKLMANCGYAAIIRKAFLEIRNSRLKREPIVPGVCVRKALPEETRLFLEQQEERKRQMDQLMPMLGYGGGGTSHTAT